MRNPAREEVNRRMDVWKDTGAPGELVISVFLAYLRALDMRDELAKSLPLHAMVGELRFAVHEAIKKFDGCSDEDA